MLLLDIQNLRLFDSNKHIDNIVMISNGYKVHFN